jgi:hypothetical protein
VRRPGGAPESKDMPAQLNRGLTRILAARQGLLDLRAVRSEMLLRFRAYAQAKLGDFVSNVDPITGMRIIELSAEGSKATGELAIVLACFEGTRLRVSVDSHAHLSVEASLPGVLPDVTRVFDVVVSADLSHAELVYEPKGAPPGTRRSADLSDILERMIDHAAQSLESVLGEASPAGPQPTAGATVTPLHPPKPPSLSFSVG